MNAPSEEPPLELDVRAVKSLLDDGADFFLLDCREPVEYQIAKIDRATLIPMSQLPERIAELEEHRQRRIVVHCHHGGRSLQVTHWLRQQGFSQAQNMMGGIDVWAVEIDRSLPRY
jgi:rhodanese-related sulfurtransferase